MSDSRETLLNQLNETIARLLDLLQKASDPDRLVYELWTAKDILAHLTFWHESFARNVRDLVNGIQPDPLKGRLLDLNQYGVDEMRQESLQQVIQRFERAHQIIRENILNPKLTIIPYRKGSRDYTPKEHLKVVNLHILEHYKELQKVFRANP